MPRFPTGLAGDARSHLIDCISQLNDSAGEADPGLQLKQIPAQLELRRADVEAIEPIQLHI